MRGGGPGELRHTNVPSWLYLAAFLQIVLLVPGPLPLSLLSLQALPTSPSSSPATKNLTSRTGQP